MRRPWALDLVSISEQNRDCLFRKAMKDSRRAVKRSRRLLAQLRSLEPGISRDFTVKATYQVEAPFRLLFARFVQNLNSPASIFKTYIVLSYCWHGKDWQPHKCLGRFQSSWPISPRMMSGLLAERRDSDEGIWIDQLCINQRSESEKQHAIGCMDLIYKSARKVVAVLEDIAISTHEEVLLQSLLDAADREFSSLHETEQRNMTLVLFRILSARWFRRAWCSHELQLSTDLVFLIPTAQGIYRMTHESLEDLYSMTTEFRNAHPDVETAYDAVESYDFLTRSFYDDDYQKEKSLMCQFSDIMKLESTIQTDKVSISMNIAGLQLLYAGGHKSRDQCRWVVAMISISSGEALALCGIEEALVTHDPEFAYPLKSWLHWYDELEDPMLDFGGSRSEQPPCIAIIDFGFMILDLLDIRETSFSRPKLHSMQSAAKFINEVLKLSESNMEFLILEDDLSSRESLIELLACSIECGHRWMIKQIASARKVAKQIRYKLQRLSFDLWPAVYDMLSPPSERDFTNHEAFPNEDRLSILQYIYFVLNHGIETVRPRSVYMPDTYNQSKGSRPEYRSVKLSFGDPALVFHG